jgi:transcriptional regulator with XRE-family HTH domain
LNDADMAFLREVQARGWTVEAARDGECIVSCPSFGCNTRLKLRRTGPIPARSDTGWRPGIVMASYDDLLDVLVLRRKTLRLAIEELEDAAGLTQDHIAKFERRNRIPNAETLLIWLETLGYEMILRPAPLPAPTLRAIATTRAKEESRSRRFARPPRTLPRRAALPSPD